MLRHTTAMRLLHAPTPIDIATIALWLGHETLDTSKYIHAVASKSPTPASAFTQRRFMLVTPPSSRPPPLLPDQWDDGNGIDAVGRLAQPEILAMKPYSSARTEGEQANMRAYLDNEDPYPPYPGGERELGLNRYRSPTIYWHGSPRTSTPFASGR